MSIGLTKIKTREEYRLFVGRMVFLVDSELIRCEKKVVEGEGLESQKQVLAWYDVCVQLPVLISLVNTIGYLRGQDGSFLGIRAKIPGSFDDQKELYALEDSFEKRLIALIEKLKTDEVVFKHIQQRVGDYFLKHRGL